MNIRVLELIQRPETISVEDISVLQNEISKFPYMQSIRTLYLSAVHQFDAENYHKELTKTAAYTTDKKILYHFINFKKEIEKKELPKFKKINLIKEAETELPNPVISDSITENKTPETEKNTMVGDTELEAPISSKAENSELINQPIHTTEVIENSVLDNGQFVENQGLTDSDSLVGDTELESPIPNKVENSGLISETEQLIDNQNIVNPNSLVGDTELENPILDNKENEFDVITEEKKLEFENKIFAELAAEEEKENDVFKTREEDLNFSKDAVLENLENINEAKIKPSEISFNGIESFLPDVKFTVPIPKQEPIAQEMFQDKKELIVEETSLPIDDNSNNVQELEIKNQEVSIVESKILEVSENQEEIVTSDETEIIMEEEIAEPEVHSDWKPMNFVQNPLDAQIQNSKPEKQKNTPEIKNTVVPIAQPVDIMGLEEVEEEVEEEVVPETSVEITKEEPIHEIEISEKAEEEPIINNMEEEIVVEDKTEEISSNIPNFVNTWQNWLKIERTETPIHEEAESIKTIEKKAEIIDKFIEENPKISQLKDEVNYIVKEKTGDISHLMTETLAKLYIEQRLYSKAITAYEALQKKYPEKQDEFEIKIQEIKDLRHNR